MVTKKLSDRLIVILILLLTVSTKVFGVLHLAGSMELEYAFDKNFLWLKIKEELMERKGLIWMRNHPAMVEAFLLNNGSECGLFFCCEDSILVIEIKNSLDMLSKSNDTVVVPYIWQLYSINGVPFDFKRYKSHIVYRELVDAELSKLQPKYSSFRNENRKGYWFVSDTGLFHDTRYARLLRFNSLNTLIDDSIINEYNSECAKRGYEKLYIGPLPSRFEEGKDSIYPEIQLLRKYVRMEDSILLNRPINYDIYDLDYIYDHSKLRKATLLSREALNKKINDSDASSNTLQSAIQILGKLTLLTSADVGVQLVTLFINTFDAINESSDVNTNHDAI